MLLFSTIGVLAMGVLFVSALMFCHGQKYHSHWRRWFGKKSSPYVPFVNIAPIVAGTNGISPIFLTTVGVTGGIGLDLKNSNDLIRRKLYSKETNIDNSSLKYNDLDELISDQGITYNTKKVQL